MSLAIRITRISHGYYEIRADYFSQALIAACKSVPGMRYEPTTHGWRGYTDALTLVERALAAKNIKVQSDPLPDGDSWRKAAITLAYSRAELRAYQIEGVKFLIARAPSGALLADVPGAGKTAQALRAARAFKAKTVVVVPSFARGVWTNEDDGGELRKWWSKASLFVPEGLTAKPIPSDTDVVVIHYDILYAWVETLLTWGVRVLVIDEIHFCASEKARRTKAVMALAEVAVARMALSGTPMTNRPRDLWSVLKILSPSRFGNFFAFCLRYADAHQVQIGSGPEAKTVWDFFGRSNAPELKERLAGHVMLRRVHADLGLELPAKTRQIIPIKIRAKAHVVPVDRLTGNAKLLRRALDLSADAKIKHVINLLRQHLDDGSNVVAFCYRRAYAEALCDALQKDHAVTFIHGGVTQKDRDRRIKTARGAKGSHLLAATIDVASTGIDLTFASVGVIAELTYEPHELIQAEARLHRFKQTKPVLIQYPIAEGTADGLIRRAVLDKLDSFEAIIGQVGDDIQDSLRSLPRGEEALKALARTLMGKS